MNEVIYLFLIGAIIVFKFFDRQGLFIRIIELSTSDMLYGPQGLDYEPISQTLAIANPGKHSILLVHID